MADHTAIAFEQVQREELSRPGPGAGLAFSGGGIRSATFCLGVLQALALKGKLRSFDYLSTVSGGGYIGGWFSAWLHRKGIDKVEAELKKSAATGQPEPAEVQWLRRYSNYLTPRVGVLSADALTVVATWLRNVFLNALILVSLVGAVHFGLVAMLSVMDFLMHHPKFNGYLSLGLASMGLAAIVLNLTLAYRRVAPGEGAVQRQKWVLILSAVPLLSAAVTGGVWLLAQKFEPGQWVDFLPIALIAIVIALGVGSLGTLRSLGLSVSKLVAYMVSAGVALSVGVALCMLLIALWPYYPVDLAQSGAAFSANLVAPILTYGPSSMLLIFGICICLWIGLVGRQFSEDSREWWSRLGGWIIFLALCWMAITLLTFYVPAWIAAAHDLGSGWVNAMAGSVWLASIPVVLKLLGSNERGPQSNAKLKRLLLNLALSLFAIGIFVLIAAGTGSLINVLSGMNYPETASTRADYEDAFLKSLDSFSDLTLPFAPWLSPALAGASLGAAIALVLAWRVDINRFSLHNMYKNRLIRCYLGASNAQRKAQPFTGFDHQDDLPLMDLVTTAKGEPQRPFHIVNTALNLVQGAELAWQERKAASFVLTPKYCGFQLHPSQGNSRLSQQPSELPAFRPTAQYASQDPSGEDLGMTLGMAMATSGAAASPNQGYHSQPSLAVLMTFLNIRLGRWSPNPARGAWRQSSPTLGLSYLLAELSGNSNEARDFVYLSDGGHFENMAVYELVRRKCSVIVAVDCGADPTRAFEDLGNMIRKCRIDFGCEIEIDLSAMFAQGEAGLSQKSFAVGVIHYNKNDPQAPKGKLIYLKPTLKKERTESVDLLNYKSGDDSFPQQATADQWFDESQFESYRKLGFDIGCECLDELGDLL